MNAIDLLEKQHRHVESVFKKLEGGHGDPAPLLRDLANSLSAHMAIEQDIFYPAVKKVKPDLVLESYEEHAIAELSLKRLLATEPSDESFKARVTTLKELIEHHVGEEEEDLFPKVKKSIREEALSEMGKAMKTRFDEVFAEGFEVAVPKGMGKTSSDVSRTKDHHPTA
jgi:hemerythrin-like domain-containing protein